MPGSPGFSSLKHASSESRSTIATLAVAWADSSYVHVLTSRKPFTMHSMMKIAGHHTTRPDQTRLIPVAGPERVRLRIQFRRQHGISGSSRDRGFGQFWHKIVPLHLWTLHAS